MSAISHGTLVGALERAVRAPSVHNTQPWRWRIADGTVELYADRTRHLPSTDPDQRDLVLSCGASLHHLRAALAASGIPTDLERLPDPERDALLATVRGAHGVADEHEAALAAAIEDRRTDRRAFVSPPTPPELRGLARIATRHGARLHPVYGPVDRARLLAVLGEAGARQRLAEGYPAELAMWTRRHAGARDGVPLEQRTQTAVAGGLRSFPAGHLAAPPLGGPETESDVLALLITPGDDPVDWLRAGEATSAVLLAATGMGLASTPLSQAVEVEQTRRAIAHTVPGVDGWPQLLVRFGRPAAGAAELEATPRRPLSWVLISDPAGAR